MAKKSKTTKKSFNWNKILTIFLVILLLVIVAALIYESHPQWFDSLKKKIENTVTRNEAPVKAQTKNTTKKKTTTATKKKESIAVKKTDSPTTGSYVDLSKIKSLEIPAEIQGSTSQIIQHKGYTTAYNSKSKIPDWVAYELTAQETGGSVKRTNKFTVDPSVTSTSATNADYSRSGYDRGHMAPAGDMNWDQDAMKESFYFSNMCPQDPSLNRGIWKKLEDRCRDWAIRDSAIMIVCGPIYNKKSATIGPNKVVVPEMFYKVILSPYGKDKKAIGFLFKNEGSLLQLQSFAVSIDSIEKLTGIDFFPLLPDTMETRIESQFTLSQWF